MNILVADDEVPEARDLDLLAVGQGFFDGFEDLLHEFGRLLLGEPYLLVDLLDDVGFRHRLSPSSEGI